MTVTISPSYFDYVFLTLAGYIARYGDSSHYCLPDRRIVFAISERRRKGGCTEQYVIFYNSIASIIIIISVVLFCRSI